MRAMNSHSLVPVVMTTFFASLPEWNPAMSRARRSRPTPSGSRSRAHQLFLIFVISSSVSGLDPGLGQVDFTRCSQVDCMPP